MQILKHTLPEAKELIADNPSVGSDDAATLTQREIVELTEYINYLEVKND